MKEPSNCNPSAKGKKSANYLKFCILQS